LILGSTLDTSGKPLDEIVENAGGSSFGEPQGFFMAEKAYYVTASAHLHSDSCNKALEK